MVNTKESFIFVYNFCAFFCICPTVNFEKKSFKKRGILHLIVYILILVCTLLTFVLYLNITHNIVIVSASCTFLLELGIGLVSNCIFVILTISILETGRNDEKWKSLIEMIIQNWNNYYWKMNCITNNLNLVQFLIGNIIHLIPMAITFLRHKENSTLVYVTAVCNCILKYIHFLNTSLWFCILWAINSNYNEIILLLQQSFNVESLRYQKNSFLTLRELQIKYTRTAEMIKLLNALFGKIIFLNIVLSGFTFLNLIVLLKFLVLADDTTYYTIIETFVVFTIYLVNIKI